MVASRHTLSNGLTVVVEPSSRAPVVAVQLWVNAGAADERRDQAGLAHVHEHMMFKGTKLRAVGEIARTIEASGGEINAWTSFDQTVYHTVSAVEELDTCLDVLSDALRRPAFDKLELERELEVIVEEINRAKDSPARRLSRALFENAFQRHPYRYPVLGTEESVRSFTRDSVLEFFQSYYRPENVIAVVVGDRERDALVDRVAHWFGDWRVDGTLGRPEREEDPSQNELRLVPVSHPVQETRAGIAWKIPNIKHRDTVALDLLGVVLGHGDSSRLASETLRRRQLVNAINAYAYTPKDPGLFVVSSTMKRENTRAAVESVMKEIVRVADRGVDESEMDKARTVMLSDSAYQRETVQGQARKLGFYEAVCGDHDYSSRYDEALISLDKQDVQRVALGYLRSPPTVVLLDETPEVDGLAELFDANRFEPAPSTTHRSTRPARRASSSAPTYVELDSGARVIVVSEESPVVAFRALAPGGLRFEDERTNGLSHLMTACWGRNTRAFDRAGLAARVASLGGSLTAFSGRNTLGLRGEFIAERWREGLQLTIDAAIESTIIGTELEQERARTLERIRNRADNPAGVAFDAFLAELFPHHPYGRRLVGTQENVSRFNASDVEAWQEDLLDPRRYVFAVVGDVDADEVVERLTPVLSGDVASSGNPSIPSDTRPDEFKQRRIQSDKAQCHVVVGSLGTTVDDPDRSALHVLTTILAGQGGRLFQDLRDDQSLAYSVSCSNVEGVEPGHVLSYGATSPDKVDTLLNALHRHLDVLTETPIDVSELERAQRYLVGTHAIDLQRAGARAMVMGLGEIFGLGFEHHLAYPDRIRSVEASDVIRVARRFLARDSRVEVVVGPQ